MAKLIFQVCDKRQLYESVFNAMFLSFIEREGCKIAFVKCYLYKQIFLRGGKHLPARTIFFLKSAN